ncbi:MAG: acetate--CoA ligase family protein [Elusimicrobiota bacterium]|jgi:acyl-CoA synthetase (NDP forming)|nr:acetate--CoA ligase family protein [Elusimicrobiota bacterium]
MDFIENLLAAAHKNGQNTLTEAECYSLFNHLGIQTPKIKIAAPTDDIKPLLEGFAGDKIVIKILSSKTLHKTDKGGVKVCLKNDAPAVFSQMVKDFPEIDAFMLVEFISYPHFALGQEILLGARFDKAFGPLITLGIGGTDAENITKKLRPGVAPSIVAAKGADFKDFVSSSFIWQYTGGLVRGGKANAKVEDLASYCQKIGEVMLKFSPQAKAPFIIEELEINPLAAQDGRLIALDGVIRFKENNYKPKKTVVTDEGIRSLLLPKTIAVVGVSETKVNMGRIILRNVIEAGFNKEDIFIIKKGSAEIDGVKCYPDCASLPRTAENMVLTVPAAAVPDVLKEAAQSGKVNGIVLISGGIGEKEGSENIREEVDNIIAQGKAKNPAFTINGSNSMGIVSNPAKMNTIFIPKNKLTPPLGVNENLAPSAFLSQSGAFVISNLSKMENIKPVYSVMTGNQLDVTTVDFTAYLAQHDDKIKVIMLYVEGLQEGEGTRLKEAVEKLTSQGRKTVIYMAGRTPTGQKAVMGHTASIAGDYPTARAILTKAGALMAETFEDFEALCQMACSYANHPLKNNKVFMISNAGFETSGMADNIEPKGPLAAPLPSDNLKKELERLLVQAKLDNIVDVRNPFDVTPMCPDIDTYNMIEAACKSGEYSAIVYSNVPLSPVVKTLKEDNPDMMPKLAALSKKYGVAVLVCVSAGERFDYFRKTAVDAGLAVFTSADNAVQKLAKFIK